MRFPAILLALLTCVAALPSSVGAEPIRVGFLAPLTGIFAQAGKDMLEGVEMAFDQAGYQAAGRKIELIVEDTEGNPAAAQTKYRKLAQQDRIHVLTGVLLSNIGYALVAPIERDQLPTLFLTTPDDLTKRRRTWAPTLSTKANQEFMKLATARGNALPAYFTAVMYSAGRWITEGAAAIDGSVEDRERFLAAIRAAIEKTDDPRGPIKLDEYNNPTQNVYVLKVEKAGGKLQNTVVHTYPLVSQFWTYSPEEFLKTPAYDRSYPPVKQ